MWVTIAIAVITSGVNLYDRSNNIQFSNLKSKTEDLELKLKELENRVSANSLVIARSDRDVDHIRNTLDKIDKNVESMNSRITNAEIGAAIMKAFNDWKSKP